MKIPNPVFLQRLIATAFCLLLAACSSLRPGYESPTVTVSSFKPVQSQGALPEFEFGLHVINPNAQSLPLRGIAYTVRLNGRELVKGVANDLPVIQGYGSGDITLHAAVDLVGGIRFFSDFMQGGSDSIAYELEAKLDVGAFLPAIRVKESGDFSLSSAGRNR